MGLRGIVDKIDVVVVGAGPAGSVAAYLLAKAGMQVVVIERGQSPGQKNVSGGLIFSRIYDQIFPGFWEQAPVERKIRGHGMMFLGEGASTTLDFRDDDGLQAPYNAFSVLRSRFDPWLVKQAEDAGAMVISGYSVDELLQKDGWVRGVRAGQDELIADVVVVAEGTRSDLLKKAGLREDFAAGDVSLGVKEIIELPESTINDRFQCRSGEGMAYTTVGSLGGVAGGGFLYTNQDTLSLGAVIKIPSLYQSGQQPHQILDQLKSHPSISRLIEGGVVVEYSAQTVHSGGHHLISRLYGDGFVVAGSAARLVLNNLVTLRGMDLAVASAAAAAKAITHCRENGNFSVGALASYETFLRDTAVYQDLVTFRHTHPILKNSRFFEDYPDLICGVMQDMFSVNTHPADKAYASLKRNMKGRIAMMDLVKDLYQIGRGLVL